MARYISNSAVLSHVELQNTVLWHMVETTLLNDIAAVTLRDVAHSPLNVDDNYNFTTMKLCYCRFPLIVCLEQRKLSFLVWQKQSGGI